MEAPPKGKEYEFVNYLYSIFYIYIIYLLRASRLDIEPGTVQGAALVPRYGRQGRRHQDLALDNWIAADDGEKEEL